MTATTNNKFWFKSRTANTGLTDVLINIKNQAGTAIVTNASMTHAAFGEYYYLFTTSTAGTYIAQMSSASERTSTTDVVVLSLSSTTSTSSTQTQYATPLQVNDYLGWTRSIPNYPVTTTLETVDSSGTLAEGSKIYLDHANVIDDTYTLYYGATSSSVTELTETTHYTINLDKSEITITATGATVIGSNSVFGSYSYNEFVKNSVISNLIDRASSKIEHYTGGKWGSLTLVNQEEQKGRGKFDRIYSPLNLPVHVVKMILNTAIDDDDTTLDVTDTTGIEAGDILSIETEQVTVSTVDDCTTLTVTRASNSTTASSHAANTWIINMAFDISNTGNGSVPIFQTLAFKADYEVEDSTGDIQLLNIATGVVDQVSYSVYPYNLYPLNDIFDRVNITYKYGTSTVPNDLIKATILSVVLDLTNSSVGKTAAEGREFSPASRTILNNEYDEIVKDYVQLLGDKI